MELLAERKFIADTRKSPKVRLCRLPAYSDFTTSIHSVAAQRFVY
jgi:hypothetical protein